jgi:hypothetical protein
MLGRGIRTQLGPNRDTLSISMTIDEITHRIREFRNERDWAQLHNPKDMACPNPGSRSGEAVSQKGIGQR